MKINRTFTMDLSTIELLAKKPNKSLIVNLAVRHYFNNVDEFEVMQNISTKRLMTNLKHRDDIDETLKIILTNLLHLTE